MGKVKVVGYAQRTFFNDGIEYRNFSDDLVGQQLTGGEGAPLFNGISFVISTNVDPKIDKKFRTNKFSNFVTLNTLDLTDSQVTFLNENVKVKLNLDKSDISRYAYFGSLREFFRVSLENIISNWVASIYVNNRLDLTDDYAITGNTVEDYTYDTISNKSTFKCSTNHLDNKYDIIFMRNGISIDNHSAEENNRNLSINYEDYVISSVSGEFNILKYTGSTSNLNDYLYFEVEGNAFTGGTSEYSENFHIKPNEGKVNEFFGLLADFEKYILNRQTKPLYTSNFSITVTTDLGVALDTTKQITWPTSDGYNLDFNTTQYVRFVTELLQMADDSDSIKTNLVSRFLVSDSITDFDTISRDDDDETGQRVDKTLKIYGREFDEIKRFADGLALANVVSYDKKDNAPDATLKGLARTLGWGLTSSMEGNDFITSYLTSQSSSYSGETIGLTPAEAETEMWRRIILNTPWIWKSKGTRKAVEFFFKFIGAPSGLIRFNEHMYRADKAIDVDELLKISSSLGLTDVDISNSYVFKLINGEEIKYYYISKSSLNINLLLTAANSGGIYITLINDTYVYESPSDAKTLQFKELMDENGIETENFDILNKMWVDQNGYPKTLPDTEDMYFQKAGLWYRETAGANSTLDILDGNNPHIGPYDGGNEYISNFNCLIPDFSAVTLIEETVSTGDTNLFTNYNNGLVNGLNYSTGTTSTCPVDIDWGGIITTNTNTCYTNVITDYLGTIDDCDITIEWTTTFYLEDVLEYTSPVFYTSSSRSDEPTESSYINALQSGATDLGLTLSIVSGGANFTTSESNRLGETLDVKLILDIDINCQP